MSVQDCFSGKRAAAYGGVREVIAVAFSNSHLSPTPMQDLVDEVCILDAEMSLWQMLQYPERENAI